MEAKDWKAGDVVKARQSLVSKCGKNRIDCGEIYKILEIPETKFGLGIRLTQETWTTEGAGWKIERFEFVRRPSEDQTPRFKVGDIIYSPIAERSYTVQRFSKDKSIKSGFAYDIASGGIVYHAQDVDACYIQETEAPKIEQKPVCMCCTIATYPKCEGVEVRHDDPCVYSADERNMLPLAKKMFREQIQRRRQSEGNSRRNKIQSDQLFQIETEYVDYGRSGKVQLSASMITQYSEITGHNFKQE